MIATNGILGRNFDAQLAGILTEKNQFKASHQFTNKSKNAKNNKPETTLICSYAGYIYSKLGYTNFFRALKAYWKQLDAYFKCVFESDWSILSRFNLLSNLFC